MEEYRRQLPKHRGELIAQLPPKAQRKVRASIERRRRERDWQEEEVTCGSPVMGILRGTYRGQPFVAHLTHGREWHCNHPDVLDWLEQNTPPLLGRGPIRVQCRAALVRARRHFGGQVEFRPGAGRL